MLKPLLKVGIQKLKNTFWHLPKSIFYQYRYHSPSKNLTLIGITGTDGKTTTAYLIHQALLKAGIRAGLISTIGAKIENEDFKIGLHTTSPDPAVVQKIFRQMVDRGLTHAVIEVTAHALDQHRFHGCHFHLCALTNTSREHLDDFISLNHYVRTKSKLFRHCDFAVINADDPSYQLISRLTPKNHIDYSIDNKSDFQAININLTADKLSFSVNGLRFITDSPYRYQIYNILAAYALLSRLDYDPDLFSSLIRQFPEIKGRREIFNNDYGIKTIIDFAHTPAALSHTLSSLKHTSGHKLIVIFGATGGRDPGKRPLMGKVVSQIADIGIITADDTRLEQIENINNQIISGIDQDRLKHKEFVYYNIPNRQDAFNLAVKLASPGDTIVACGKGHETTILHGKTEYPWSESEAFRTAFRQKLDHQ